MLAKLKNVYRKVIPVIFTETSPLRSSAIFLLTVGGIALNVAMPYLFNEVLVSFGGDSVQILTSEAVSLTLISTFACAWSFSHIIAILRKALLSQIEVQATYHFAYKSIEHLMKQSLRFHTTAQMGNHVDILGRCYKAIPELIGQSFMNVIPTTLEVTLASSVLAYFYGPLLGFSLAGTLVVYGIYNASVAAPLLIQAEEERLQKIIQSHSKTLNLLTHYETVHTCNNLEHELRELDDYFSQTKRAEIKSTLLPNKIALGQMIILGVGFTVISLYLGHGVLMKEYTSDDFIIICYYLIQFAMPLNSFGNAINKIYTNVIDLEKVMQFLETAPEILDMYPQRQLQVKKETAAIVFDHVYFKYDHDRFVLKDVSFTIQPGKKIGLVGVNGAGKSTIAKLLLRFYDVNSGQIKINDQDIRNISISSLRDAISIVPQSPVLFNDTLRNNVRYGNLTANDDETSEALIQANVDKFIPELSNGLETMVGERGLKISGGQLQRIAIARALLKRKKSHIFLFDEVTSALDSNQAEEIKKMLDEVTKTTTTLWITHQLALLENADKIIVLNEGEVVAQGTHKELLLSNNIYRSMWHKQAANYKLKYAADTDTYDGSIIQAAASDQYDFVDDGQEQRLFNPKHNNNIRFFNPEKEKNIEPTDNSSQNDDETLPINIYGNEPEAHENKRRERCGIM
jgi:ABC-type transport system involved in Fe-S cluster assembly fused permease/ATPase subunit